MYNVENTYRTSYDPLNKTTESGTLILKHIIYKLLTNIPNTNLNHLFDIFTFFKKPLYFSEKKTIKKEGNKGKLNFTFIKKRKRNTVITPMK